MHPQNENETAKLSRADVSHAARGWETFPGLAIRNLPTTLKSLKLFWL